MVRIGIVGIGFMGMTHFEAATKRDGEKIVGSKLRGGAITAIATRDPTKLSGDWTSIQGNFGPPGPRVDLSPLKTYADYHELLADPDVDLVDICLPTDMHERVVLESLAAGKHTLVEKPIAIEMEAAQRMVAAAEKAGVLLMVAHVLPFFPEFRFAADCIRSGRYGRLLAAHFRRVITPPTWSKDMADFRRLGGWGIDLHIHDNHFIGYVQGIPRAVHSCGILREGLVNHVHTHYIYEKGEPAVSCVSGGIAQPGLQFANGFEIYLERATMLFDAGTYGTGSEAEWRVTCPLTLMTDDGAVSQPELEAGTEWCAAFTEELQAAVDGVAAGRAPDVLSGRLARDALQLCHAEAQSIAQNRPVDIHAG